MDYCGRYGNMYNFFKNRIMSMYSNQMHANSRVIGSIVDESNDLIEALSGQVQKRVAMFRETYNDFVSNDERAYRKMQDAFIASEKTLKCNPYYVTMLHAREFPEDKICSIFNECADRVQAKVLSLGLRCNSLDDLRAIVERYCDYVKEVIEQFEDYLHGVEDVITNVIAGGWETNLTNTAKLKVSEPLYNFNLLVRFTCGFSKSYCDESLNKKDNFSSCMLISQDTIHNYQNRKFGFIIPMEAENLVVMNTGDAHSALISLELGNTMDYSRINYSDVIENYYWTFTPVDSHKILTFQGFSDRVKKKECDESIENEAERYTNEIIMKTDVWDKPLLITSDVPEKEVQNYKGLAHVLGVDLILWNKEGHYIEKLVDASI